MADDSVSRIAYLLVLVGGVLMVVFGFLALIESSFGEGFTHWGFTYSGILTIISGIIAIFGAKKTNELLWAIILIIFGILGGGLGDLLVIVGAIIGLLAKAL